MQLTPDICIAGAGIVSLSLALELEKRGASVCILERDTPLVHASQAAAGMLAAHDPENPPELRDLADLSLSLYPAFLDRIAQLSGHLVPFQTSQSFQLAEDAHIPPDLPAFLRPGPFHVLAENSLDPRQLAPALLAAVQNTPIRLLQHTSLQSVTNTASGLLLETTRGSISPRLFVSAQGPWNSPSLSAVNPCKGQMLSVRIPPDLPLDFVVRTPEIYIVPRLRGPRAGQAVIGATVEDAGFSTSVHAADLDRLHTLAATLIPALGEAPVADRWAGLRPDTPDHLPLLGALPHRPGQFVATGHYRNGILLAPATAHVLAQLLAGESPSVSLDAFSPARFASDTSEPLEPPIFAHRS